jgi:5-methylcytosine-specific restriction endonuclease McrA
MSTKISKARLIEVCQTSSSMAKAASVLHIHFNTLKRLALLYNCYKPNQGLKGGNKNSPVKMILQDILDGRHPHFQTYKLKNRMIKSGIIKNNCTICGIDTWNSKKINLELDHIDGNRFNHILSNLRLLCPNCHSQTDTYRSKNRLKSE